MADVPKTTADDDADTGCADDKMPGSAEQWRAAADSLPRILRREPAPVECEMCGWRGRRIAARSAPCPCCGNEKVQYR